MKLEIFLKELQKALVSRGIAEESAKKHIVSLYRSFTSDDLAEIESINSSNEINQLADNIARIINNSNKTSANADATKALRGKNDVSKSSAPASTTSSPKKENNKQPTGSDDDYFEYHREPEPSARGLTIFWVGLFVTLPITLALLLLLFGAFAAAFLGLIGLIIGCILLLVVTVAAGSGISLVGIIYGITQLFSFPAAGIYEIGLGVTVAGIALLLSILIYNFAIRFVPWVISYLAVFLKFVCGKLKTLFVFVRKECYKL